MNTSVAGFNTVLPSQNAIAGPGAAWCRRMPTTTGAAQQVHIIPGIASKPPATTPPKPWPPSTRRTQSAGNNAWMPEPSNRPSSIACQIALP